MSLSRAPQSSRRASITVFAPATIGNVGVGYDVLGLALADVGDTVHARLCDEPGVRLVGVHGDGGALGRGCDNTAVVAARAVLRAIGYPGGVELELRKGLPVGTGMGSSAASAAAAAYAVNRLVGSPLGVAELVGPCTEAEEVASGRHADNVAPALLGGLVLVRSLGPLDVVSLPIPDGLWVCVVRPHMTVSTRIARSVLPAEVPLSTMVAASANLAAFVAACHSGDLGLLSRSLVDPVVTPLRASLVPGAPQALEAARALGALGASISGSGPSLFALCDRRERAARCAESMMSVFAQHDLTSDSLVCAARNPGAREVAS